MDYKNVNLHNNLSCGTIFSLDKGESTMSVMLMGFNEKGAVIATDSRETFDNGYFNDEKIKVFINDKIIIGQIGLNSILKENKKINLAEILVNNLLQGKTINDAIQIKIDDISIKELIPDNKIITIFYAKKDGEIGIYDISKNGELSNKNNNSFGFCWNESSSTIPFIKMITSKIKVNSYDNISLLKEKTKFIINEILKFEKNYEKFTRTTSYIGGKIQLASIKFKK